MSKPVEVCLALFGGLTAVALAAIAGWLIGSAFRRMHQGPSQRGGPLLWLTRRSRRFWILAMTIPMLYLASFGPACWISGLVQPEAEFVNLAYPHLIKIMWHRSSLGYESLLWRYVTVGADCGVGPESDGQIRIRFRRVTMLELTGMAAE